MNESLDDKKRQRDTLKLLVDSDVKATKFDTDCYKRVSAYIIGTFGLSYFFMWCSSNSESNFFVALNNNKAILYMFCAIPLIIIIIFEVSVIRTAVARKEKINIECLQEYIYQRKIFAKFIRLKLGYKHISEDYISVKKLYKDSMIDVEFDFYEFRDFIQNTIIKKYKCKFPMNFDNHLADLILYNEEVEGTLIKTNDKSYTFIIKDNFDFLMHALNE